MKLNNYIDNDELIIKCDKDTEEYLSENGLMYITKIIENNVEYFIFFKTEKLLKLLEVK